METLQIIGIILAAVGAIHLGLVGLFKFALVALVAGGKSFGELNPVSRLVYILVAVAGVIAATAITEV